MKHFISLNDLSIEDFGDIFELALTLKKQQKEGVELHPLKGRKIALIFSKPSTRTRVSFEAGIVGLGGYPLFLGASDIQLGRGETISDTAKCLSRYVDGIMIRTFKQSDVEDLAKYGSIPVINGLTDDMHPCQIMADLLTALECKGKLKGLKLAYVGDGNNVANSLLHGCAKTGIDIYVASPKGYQCAAKYVTEAVEAAKNHDSKVVMTDDPVAAVEGADIVYTDTWASMGQEAEKDARLKVFGDYQVNKELFSRAKPDAVFMHCLPAYRGFEVTEEVIDSERSVVFDEAENRMHVQNAIMVRLMA
ncbi:MAG: ornithine carbamoyltransferase [Oscillospiraceae bacterium]|nr:ornithine carbamoyltransferase [Oscillospiraceae bacterium]